MLHGKRFALGGLLGILLLALAASNVFADSSPRRGPSLGFGVAAGQHRGGIYGDSDGDRVIDLFDAFPKDPTEWRDSDRDGVGDNKDACSQQGGIVDASGCPPDSDHDGVIDTEDACPSKGGIVDPDGCPSDSDNDGLPDNIDRCPFEGGIVDSHGCPSDEDSDGVVDNHDACPSEGGIVGDDGCPVAVTVTLTNSAGCDLTVTFTGVDDPISLTDGASQPAVLPIGTLQLTATGTCLDLDQPVEIKKNTTALTFVSI